jgi:hypothetical protein
MTIEFIKSQMAKIERKNYVHPSDYNSSPSYAVAFGCLLPKVYILLAVKISLTPGRNFRGFLFSRF